LHYRVRMQSICRCGDICQASQACCAARDGLKESVKIGCGTVAYFWYSRDLQDACDGCPPGIHREFPDLRRLRCPRVIPTTIAAICMATPEQFAAILVKRLCILPICRISSCTASTANL